MNTKAASERYQRQVQDISKQSGNNTCADCNGRYPRWASWNLGIFLCVNCAGVHRKMGTHISKVKSLTLDTWTKEQVERMREIGNIKSNMKFNPDERRNRPPANVEEGERNSELERFIFDKYRGKFMDSLNPPPVPIKDKWHVSPNPTGSTSSGDSSRKQFPSNSLGTPSSVNKSASRSSTSPFPSTWADAQRAASVSPAPPVQATSSSASTTTLHAPPLPDRSGSSASISRITSSGNGLAPPVASVPPRSSSASIYTQNGSNGNGTANGHQGITATANATSKSSVFDDLLSLQEPAQPFVQPTFQMVQPGQQLNPWAHLATQQQAVVSPMVMSHTVNGIESSSSPFFQQQQQQQPARSPFGQAGFAGAGDQQRSVSLGAMAFTPTGMHLQQQQQFSPQMMGQQAFGGQYASATQSQQQSFFAGQQQQQQPGPITNNPFGSFASTMMPTGMQQQSAAYQQPMWTQQQQTQQQQPYQPFNQWQ